VLLAGCSHFSLAIQTVHYVLTLLTTHTHTSYNTRCLFTRFSHCSHCSLTVHTVLSLFTLFSHCSHCSLSIPTAHWLFTMLTTYSCYPLPVILLDAYSNRVLPMHTTRCLCTLLTAALLLTAYSHSSLPILTAHYIFALMTGH
jgi:hypothetical protein